MASSQSGIPFLALPLSLRCPAAPPLPTTRSPTKNKGLVEMSHGWEEVAYVTAQKVHTRFYKSLLFEGEEEQ